MVVAAFALTGCAGVVTQPSLSHSNPANPNAPEASYPAAAPVLMNGTNFAMSPETEEKEMPGDQPPTGEMKMDKSMKMDKPKPVEPHDHNVPNQ